MVENSYPAHPYALVNAPQVLNGVMSCLSDVIQKHFCL